MNGLSMRQKKGPPTFSLIFFIVAFVHSFFLYYSNIAFFYAFKSLCTAEKGGKKRNN